MHAPCETARARVIQLGLELIGGSGLTAGRRWHARLTVLALALTPAIRGMIWMAIAGLVFTFLNTIMKYMSASLAPIQIGFLR